MNDLSAESMRQAIVAAHASRFGIEPAHHAIEARLPGSRAGRDPVEAAAQAACEGLGFIPADAECLGAAWASRTRRERRFDALRWPDDPQDFGLRSFPLADRDDAFPACPQVLGLYAVLPDAAWVGRLARAGVPTVQLRFKSEDPQAIEAEVRAAVDAVRGTHARLFINDHWQAAIQAGAYGVHLGQEDLDALPAEAAQQLRERGLRLGLSTHGYAEMLRADLVSPSYIALGAVFPTTLKKMATAPQGLARLADYARLMQSYPLVAIGGIDEARIPEVASTGVGSIAVVRALIAADDPEAAAARLMRLLDQHRIEAPPR